MKIPSFVEDSVTRKFDSAAGAVNVADIAIRGGITNEDTTKVMAVELGASLPSPFNTDAGTEGAKALEVRPVPEPSFERCDFGSMVDGVIDNVGGMHNRS